jgi:hypothetical protein
MYGFLTVLRVNSNYLLSNINQIIYVMEKCYALFKVGTGFLMLFRRVSASQG